MLEEMGGLATAQWTGSRPLPIGSRSIGVSLQPASPRRVAPHFAQRVTFLPCADKAQFAFEALRHASGRLQYAGAMPLAQRRYEHGAEAESASRGRERRQRGSNRAAWSRPVGDAAV